MSKLTKTIFINIDGELEKIKQGNIKELKELVTLTLPIINH